MWPLITASNHCTLRRASTFLARRMPGIPYAETTPNVSLIVLANRSLRRCRIASRAHYRRITALMRRKGKSINAKRVQRVRRQAGLQVKERQRRTRRVGPTLVKRLRAQQANQVWSWDLLYDQTEHGRSL